VEDVFNIPVVFVAPNPDAMKVLIVCRPEKSGAKQDKLETIGPTRM
jgi:hypothetical protein